MAPTTPYTQKERRSDSKTTTTFSWITSQRKPPWFFPPRMQTRQSSPGHIPIAFPPRNASAMCCRDTRVWRWCSIKSKGWNKIFFGCEGKGNSGFPMMAFCTLEPAAEWIFRLPILFVLCAMALVFFRDKPCFQHVFHFSSKSSAHFLGFYAFSPLLVRRPARFLCGFSCWCFGESFSFTPCVKALSLVSWRSFSRACSPSPACVPRNSPILTTTIT